MVLATAREHYARSTLIAQRAAREASKVSGRGLVSVAQVLVTHQVAQAQTSESAVAAMLAEQGTSMVSAGRLNALAYTTSTEALGQMLDSAGNEGFDRLILSLVQAAGRSAESVASTARDVGHVRYLSPPSCSRCAVLAGRFYRWSDGFKRHPLCDCTMVPSRDSGLAVDVADLVKRGLVTGMSKADLRAVNDGADVSQVVNVRRKEAGLQESGAVLSRAGRPTPEGIYRIASDQTEAVALLKRFGFIR